MNQNPKFSNDVLDRRGGEWFFDDMVSASTSRAATADLPMRRERRAALFSGLPGRVDAGVVEIAPPPGRGYLYGTIAVVGAFVCFMFVAVWM